MATVCTRKSHKERSPGPTSQNFYPPKQSLCSYLQSYHEEGGWVFSLTYLVLHIISVKEYRTRVSPLTFLRISQRFYCYENVHVSSLFFHNSYSSHQNTSLPYALHQYHHGLYNIINHHGWLTAGETLSRRENPTHYLLEKQANLLSLNYSLISLNPNSQSCSKPTHLYISNHKSPLKAQNT